MKHIHLAMFTAWPVRIVSLAVFSGFMWKPFIFLQWLTIYAFHTLKNLLSGFSGEAYYQYTLQLPICSRKIFCKKTYLFKHRVFSKRLSYTPVAVKKFAFSTPFFITRLLFFQVKCFSPFISHLPLSDAFHIARKASWPPFWTSVIR